MKKISYINTYSFFIICFIFFSCKKSKEDNFKDRISSIDALFENSKVEEVAKNVNSDNYGAVKDFFIENPNIDVDTKSPYTGSTLLQLASARQKYEAAKALLESGANPNIEELKIGSQGSSSFTYILLSRDTTLIKFYINHGADINKISKLHSTTWRTPLITACKADLNSVKFLIKYGANPHVVYNKYESALNSALAIGGIEIVNYLIFELKVDYKKPYFYGHSITWALRNMAYPINSEKYIQKMKLVKFLKDNNIDYYAEPIPERFFKLYDEDYLFKY